MWIDNTSRRFLSQQKLMVPTSTCDYHNRFFAVGFQVVIATETIGGVVSSIRSLCAALGIFVWSRQHFCSLRLWPHPIAPCLNLARHFTPLLQQGQPSFWSSPGRMSRHGPPRFDPWMFILRCRKHLGLKMPLMWCFKYQMVIRHGIFM